MGRRKDQVRNILVENKLATDIQQDGRIGLRTQQYILCLGVVTIYLSGGGKFRKEQVDTET